MALSKSWSAIGAIVAEATEVVQKLFRVQLIREEEVERIEQEERKQRIAMSRTGSPPAAKSPQINPEKIGRNDSCPCGSGKKYKKCCGS